ncbi:Uncharacterised protein [Mycobacteroides abscessus subsp. abscessus]|nr:Uncharacterised protein [Mycobacteroides abscessus subsp. abscessus]
MNKLGFVSEDEDEMTSFWNNTGLNAFAMNKDDEDESSANLDAMNKLGFVSEDEDEMTSFWNNTGLNAFAMK